MSVVLGVPEGSPELTLRAGVGYGPGPAVSLNWSQTQTVAPGTSKLFTVANNAPSTGRTTALVTVRAGGVIPDGAKFTVSEPVLVKGSKLGPFIHGDMPADGALSYSWEGKRHGSASVQTLTTVSRPAVLDFVRDPATGDMHKGDEVIVTGDNAARVLAGVVDNLDELSEAVLRELTVVVRDRLREVLGVLRNLVADVVDLLSELAVAQHGCGLVHGETPLERTGKQVGMLCQSARRTREARR